MGLRSRGDRVGWDCADESPPSRKTLWHNLSPERPGGKRLLGIHRYGRLLLAFGLLLDQREELVDHGL